jgi:hypothetical protein
MFNPNKEVEPALNLYQTHVSAFVETDGELFVAQAFIFLAAGYDM